MTQPRSPVFVVEFESGGSLSQALPSDPADARRILHRLLPVLPPVAAAYVVPDSTIRETP